MKNILHRENSSFLQICAMSGEVEEVDIEGLIFVLPSILDNGPVS